MIQKKDQQYFSEKNYKITNWLVIPKKWVQFIEKNKLIYSLFRQLNYPVKLIKKLYFNIVDEKKDKTHLMINIGGQNYVKRHWKNLDYNSSKYNYSSFFLDYPFDLTSKKSLPFNNEEVSVFYSSHTVEHIPQEYTEGIFKEIVRALKPGGVFRVTMPDFDLAYNAYKNKDLNFPFHFYTFPKDRSLEDRFLHFFAMDLEGKGLEKEVISKFKTLSKEDFANYFTEMVPRDLQKKTQNHISWWNYDKMYKQLKKAGFTNVYRSEKSQSKFKELRQTGIDQRPSSFSLFVEAIK